MINEGGQAFPMYAPKVAGPGGHEEIITPGLSARQYIACQVLQGLVTRTLPAVDTQRDDREMALAVEAFRHADHFLRADKLEVL